jgi:hypothetical protein
MQIIAQLEGAPQPIANAFELAITMRPNSNGSLLTTGVGELISYLRERGLVTSSGPNHMRGLVLARGSADEAPAGCRLRLREINVRANCAT